MPEEEGGRSGGEDTRGDEHQAEERSDELEIDEIDGATQPVTDARGR